MRLWKTKIPTQPTKSELLASADIWERHPLWVRFGEVSNRPKLWVIALITATTVLGLFGTFYTPQIILNPEGYDKLFMLIQGISLAFALFIGWLFSPVVKVAASTETKQTSEGAAYLGIFGIAGLMYLAAMMALARGLPIPLSYIVPTQQEVTRAYDSVRWQDACRRRCAFDAMMGTAGGYYRMSLTGRPAFATSLIIADPRGFNANTAATAQGAPQPTAVFRGEGNWFALRLSDIEAVPISSTD
mgnify:CR=1 FL=1